MNRSLIIILFLLVSLPACNQDGSENTGGILNPPTAVDLPAKPAMTADQFIAGVNERLKDIYREEAAADWLHATYINDDSALVAARAGERFLAYQARVVKQSRQYTGKPMSPETARAIKLLRLMTAMPAPDDPDKRAELTQISAGSC